MQKHLSTGVSERKGGVESAWETALWCCEAQLQQV